MESGCLPFSFRSISRSNKNLTCRSVAVCYVMYSFVMFLVGSYVTVTVGLVLAEPEVQVAEESTTEAPKHKIQDIDGMQWRIMHKPPDCFEESDIGDRLEVHYTGYLENGMIFDSSIKKQRPPIGFTLGAKHVIDGWDKGLIGMCVGEKRRLIVPSHMAYGEAGYPPSIPPRAKLLFEVSLERLIKTSIWSSNINYGINIIKICGPPVILIYLMYYLYCRYKSEMAEKKDEKKKIKKRR